MSSIINRANQTVRPAGQPVQTERKIKKVAVAAATILVLLMMCLFVWRVAYFSSLIRTGQIDLLNTRFAGDQSQSFLALQMNENVESSDVVTEDDPHLGSENAKVTIVEFADFACPYCRQSSFIMRSLAARYGDQIHYIFRDWPVAELYPQAWAAAQAANCANQQGKFWEYHDKLFVNQSRQQEADLLRYAQELNLDINAFRVCLVDEDVKEEIMDDFEEGAKAGVYGTPTFFINGRRIPGTIPEAALEKVIDTLLAQ